jgi:hypothetical protein
VPLGVVDHPVALACEIAIQRVQGGPQLSGGCGRLSPICLAPKMMQHRADTIDADLSILGFAIPQPLAQPFDFLDDDHLCRHPCRMISRQGAGDWFEVLKPHTDVEPVKNRRSRDVGIGDACVAAQSNRRNQRPDRSGLLRRVNGQSRAKAADQLLVNFYICHPMAE